LRSSNLLDPLDFLYHAPTLREQLSSLSFFHTCLPVWGVILVKVISKSNRLNMGLQRIYFSLVKGLSKMVFPHLKLNALRIGMSCFHVRMQSDLFIQIKLSFWVTSWFFFCLWFCFWFCFVFFLSSFLGTCLPV
jgi:hypothetical protein